MRIACFMAVRTTGSPARLASQEEGADIFAAPSISVKLSALHPRYSYLQHDRVMDELVPLVSQLAEHAMASGIALTVDAEEADRLEISLEVFSQVMRGAHLNGYDGLGLALQTYQRRATDVLRYLEGLAKETGRRIPVRLVKAHNCRIADCIPTRGPTFPCWFGEARFSTLTAPMVYRARGCASTTKPPGCIPIP